MINVVVTGGTGFIGAHVIESLLNNNIEVIALKRISSDCWRCKEFKNIHWIDIDSGDCEWKDKIISFNPDYLIHSAWIGVEANDRNDLELQVKNLNFLATLLELAKEAKIKKIICFGSQAEYGIINSKIKESAPVLPTSAYGSIKVAASEIVRSFSFLHNIDWIWLRLFSFYGEKENESWLIPSVIKKMFADSAMDFTRGEQKIAYLHIKDFGEIVALLLLKNVESGIYNVSANEAYPLKEIVEKICQRVNKDFKPNFGALDYRQNQPMHVEGDITKLLEQIGDFKFTSLDDGLESTIKYYLR